MWFLLDAVENDEGRLPGRPFVVMELGGYATTVCSVQQSFDMLALDADPSPRSPNVRQLSAGDPIVHCLSTNPEHIGDFGHD